MQQLLPCACGCSCPAELLHRPQRSGCFPRVLAPSCAPVCSQPLPSPQVLCRWASRRRAGGNRLAHRCTQPCCLFCAGCLARINALLLKLRFTCLRSPGRLWFCVSARCQVVVAKQRGAGQDLATCKQLGSSTATLTSGQPASSPALFICFDSTGPPVLTACEHRGEACRLRRALENSPAVAHRPPSKHRRSILAQQSCCAASLAQALAKT